MVAHSPCLRQNQRPHIEKDIEQSPPKKSIIKNNDTDYITDY
jgi:hypothetical protein